MYSIRKSRCLLLFASLFIYGVSAARAAEQIYSIVPTPSHPTGIWFHIPYSMGTHDGEALEVAGAITIDLDHPKSATGGFRVPIQSLRTGNKTRDCHLLEALGLNYTNSKYPKDHVCDDDKLPATGVDAIMFPDIEFRLKSLQFSSEQVSAVYGEWIIHGVNQPTTIPVKVTPEGTGFRIQGTSNISLKAHQIEVKPAKILFVSIGVDDNVTVTLDLHLLAGKHIL